MLASRHVVPTAVRDGDGYGGPGFVVDPLTNSDPATVIVLHGLGSTGEEWGALCLAISYFSLNYIKFILPTAPRAYIQYQNITTNSWFNIPSLNSLMESEDLPSLLESVARVNNIIQGEINRGVPEERIFVLGFSQGGALGLTLFLQTPFRIGGFIGISSWLPLPQNYPAALRGATAGAVLVLQNGGNDPTIIPYYANKTASTLRALGRSPTYIVYPAAGHFLINDKVISMTQDFIYSAAQGETQMPKTWVQRIADDLSTIRLNLPQNGLGIKYPYNGF